MPTGFKDKYNNQSENDEQQQEDTFSSPRILLVPIPDFRLASIQRKREGGEKQMNLDSPFSHL